MRIKQQVSTILLAITLLNITACQSAPQTSNETTAIESESTETTELVYHDSVPDTDYEGREFRILNGASTSYNTILNSDEITGELVEDAVYERNRNIESRFNVVIAEEYTNDLGANKTTAQNIIAAGDDAYDYINLVDRDALSLAQEGYAYRIDELKYIDLTQPWWSQTLNSDLSIRNKLYFAYGDLNLTSYHYTFALMFNKAIAEEYALEDFYTLVNDGKWTFDKFGEIIRSVSNDLNGDSVMDENDQYGLVALDKHVLPSFWIAGGVKTIEKNDADEPVFTIPTNEKFSDVFNSIFEMIRDSNSYLANVDLFQQGRALFTLNTIGSVTGMREMEDDFGILPLPKYDESQAIYYTRVGGGSLPIVPITISDPDFVGAIIEALTCESKNTVIPAYYDVALKTKYVRDEASVDMLNIIFENRIYDLGDTYWCMQLRDGIFAGMFTADNRDLSSKLASMKSTMDGLTQATIEAFED